MLQITAWVDEGLDKDSFIVPGLGDFGDRSVLSLRHLLAYCLNA